MSAGIKFTEVDLSLYASNTSETYFGVVGYFSKGPLAATEPKLITSYPELLKYFGKPRSDGTSHAWYACREYLRRGNKLKVVRVESTATPATASSSSLRGHLKGSVLETQADGTTAGAPGQFDSALATFQTKKVQPGDILQITVGADVGFYEIETVPLETRVTVKNVSAWPVGGAGQTYEVFSGQRQELADGATSTPALRQFTSVTGKFTAGTANCNVQAGDILVIEDAGTPADDGRYIIESVTNATTLVVNRDWPTGSLANLSYKIYTYIAGQEIGATSIPATRTLTSAGHDFTTHGVVAGDILVVNDAGDTGDNGTYVITNVAATVLTINQDWPVGSLANLTFRVLPASVKLSGYYKGTWGDSLEIFCTSYIGDTANKVNLEIRESGITIEEFKGCGYSTIVADMVGSEAVVPVVIAGRGGIPADHDMDFAGGVDGNAGIVDGDYIGVAGSGLQLFASAEAERVDILAVPGVYSQAVGDALVAIGESRQNCMVVLDPPPWATVDTPEEAVQWHNGIGGFGRTTPISSSYAAIYWPEVKVYDEYHSAYRWTFPSGFVAAAMTYNDIVAHPWWAPAGGNRGMLIGASGLRMTPDKGQRDYMQDGTNCVNPLVVFANEGTMIYGQKTCYRYTTARNRIETRRMLVWLAIKGGTALRKIIFDPNDESTWKQVHDVLNPLLRFIKKKRGLNDYLVVCDSTNNTALTIANHQLIVDVYMKEIGAAEDLNGRFILTSQDANFEDLMGA